MKERKCAYCNIVGIFEKGESDDNQSDSVSKEITCQISDQPSFYVPGHELCLDVRIPPIGIGTYELRGEKCVEAVRFALQLGFRLIDTAAVYRNEELVGEGIRSSKVPREELFINVKIAMKSIRNEETLRAGILKSIKLLGIGYADAVLVHWPGAGGLKPEDKDGHSRGRRLCWKVLHELQTQGITRCFGVSNYYPKHFIELLEMPWSHTFPHYVTQNMKNVLPVKQGGDSKPPSINIVEKSISIDTKISGIRVKQSDSFCFPEFSGLPVINQIELHPLCAQEDVVKFCRNSHMHIQQYSPLGKGDERLLKHPELHRLQQAYFSNYSVTDMLLLWGLVNRFIPLVRSGNEEHLRRNWQLTVDYVASLQTSLSSDQLAILKESSFVTTMKPSRPPLTSKQLQILLHLRHHLGIKEDIHLCWDSITIA